MPSANEPQRSPLAVYPQDTVAGEPQGKGRLAALVGASAATALIATVAAWEGLSTKPYADKLANGILTVCYGDTEVEMRRYTKAECQELLGERLADYAAPVLARNPELKGRDAQIVAATSLAYNIGVGNYHKSRVARYFSEGKWVSACNAFRSWVYAGGKRVQGLANRREAERRICLQNIPADKMR